MSFYRSLLAAVVAVAIVTPALAEDNVDNQKNSSEVIQISQSGDETKATVVSDQANQADQTNQANTTNEQIKVNLNKADAKELTKVKGLNSAKARAIVSYRKKHGDFKTLDELAKVKGFKKMKSEKLKEVQDQLTLES